MWTRTTIWSRRESTKAFTTRKTRKNKLTGARSRTCRQCPTSGWTICTGESTKFNSKYVTRKPPIKPGSSSQSKAGSLLPSPQSTKKHSKVTSSRPFRMELPKMPKTLTLLHWCRKAITSSTQGMKMSKMSQNKWAISKSIKSPFAATSPTDTPSKTSKCQRIQNPKKTKNPTKSSQLNSLLSVISNSPWWPLPTPWESRPTVWTNRNEK